MFGIKFKKKTEEKTSAYTFKTSAFKVERPFS